MLWFKRPTGASSSSRVQPTIDFDREIPPGAIPLGDEKTIIEEERSLISRIRLTAGMSDEAFSQLYTPLINTYASYVMSLPATRANHHFRPGGMWQYGLEVGLLALQTADSKIFSGSEPVEHRHLLEPRWRVAAFCAGLLMDIGAVVTDMRILGSDGERWEPLLMPLATWARGKGYTYYYVQWLPSSLETDKKLHRLFSGILAARLLSVELQTYLVQGSTAILHELVLALSGMKLDNSQNTLLQMIDQSRSASIEREIRARGGLIPTGTVGMPVESYLLDGLRNLTRSSWRANQAGSPLWVTRHGVFIHWDTAAKELRALLKSEGVGGIPLEAHTMAEILLSHQIAVRPPPGRAHDVYWSVDMPGVGKVAAIRLASAEVLFGANVPQAVEIPISTIGRIDATKIGGTSDAETAGTSTPQQTDPAEAAARQKSEAGSPDNRTGEPETQNTHVGSTTGEQPMVGGVHPNTNQGRDPGKERKRPPRRTAAEALAWLRKQGKAGELLAALGEDCKNGKKRVDIDVFWMDTGLAVVFPAGLAGFGFDPAKALEAICDKGWAVTDSKTNRSVLHDIANQSGMKTRALVLTPTVGTAVAAIAGIEHPAAAGKRVPSTDAGAEAPAVSANFQPSRFFAALTEAAVEGSLPFALSTEGQGVVVPFPDAFEWFVSRHNGVRFKDLVDIMTRKDFVIPNRGMAVILEDGKKSRVVFRREYCAEIFGRLENAATSERLRTNHADPA
jgi:conjugal transfer pilus assembly protein TraI